MKRLMVAAAVAGGVLYGQGAFAKTLEDVLKEKGVMCGMQQSYAAKFFLANKADFCIL